MGAASSGSLPMCRVLLQHGASPNAQDRVRGMCRRYWLVLSLGWSLEDLEVLRGTERAPMQCNAMQ